MRLATLLRYLYLSYFSKPASERVLYRAVRRTRAKKVLEIGIKSTERTLRLIRLASCYADSRTVQYAAIDLFEARPGSQSGELSLKNVHRLLKKTSAQVQLIPGDPAGALARVANSLPNVDIVIISAAHDEAALAGAWFYLPRMLHPRSLVYLETPDAQSGETTLRLLSASEIETRASAPRRRRAA